MIAGDGCLIEGVGQEAIDLAGHLRLGRLVVLWDDNRITIDGDIGLSTSIDQAMRFAPAAGGCWRSTGTTLTRSPRRWRWRGARTGRR